MILQFTLFLIIVGSFEYVECSYNQFNNKTKRAPSQHLFNYGETRPILVFSDTPISPVYSNDGYNNLKPTEFKTAPTQADLVRQVKVYPQDLPHPTYEFANTQNGPFNQFLQPVLNKDAQVEHYREQTLQPVVSSHNFISAETMSLPVEQRNILRDQQVVYPNTNIRLVPLKKPIQKFNYELLNSPQNGNTQYNSPISQLPYQQQIHTTPLFPNYYNSNFQKTQNVPIVNYINRNHSPASPVKQNLNLPKYITPPVHHPNTPPPRNQLQTVPSKVTLKKDENSEVKNGNEKLPKNELQKNEDDDSEEKSHVEDEDTEREEAEFQHSYNFEESDAYDYKDDKGRDSDEEEYERDNKRGSSTNAPSKRPNRRHKSNNVREHYRYPSSDHKRGYADTKTSKKSNKTPKMLYKSIRYSKESDDSDDDSIEGRHSENIPVTRKHRLFREKWFITKNMDDSEKD